MVSLDWEWLGWDQATVGRKGEKIIEQSELSGRLGRGTAVSKACLQALLVFPLPQSTTKLADCFMPFCSIFTLFPTMEPGPWLGNAQLTTYTGWLFNTGLTIIIRKQWKIKMVTKGNIHNTTNWSQSVSTSSCAIRKGLKSSECHTQCIYCTC